MSAPDGVVERTVALGSSWHRDAPDGKIFRFTATVRTLAPTVSDLRQYRKSLGVIELFCLGIGGTIGSGIFVVPGVVAGLAGPASLIAWAIVAVSACTVAFALGSVQASSGVTFATLFAQSFGRPIAALLVVLYVMSSVFGIATIAAGVGQYLAYFGLGELRAIEVAIMAAFLIINRIGVTLSGVTENALSLVKVGAIAMMIAVLAPFVHAANLIPSKLPSAQTLLGVIIIVFWPFTGFEISAIPVAETKDPRRIARALLLVMVFVCAVYLALNVVLIGAVGSADLAASPAPVAYAMGLVFPGSGGFVAIVGIVTMLSALNAYIVGASRVLQDGAKLMGVAPLARLSNRGVPATALDVTCGAAALMLLVSNRFDTLAAASVVTTLVPYAAICVAAARRAQTATVRVVAITGAVVTTGILVLYFAS